MKKISIIIGLLMSIPLFAQKKEYDKNIIGCYKGSEENQQVNGLSKYWISCRLDKGKSVLLFIGIKNGEVTQTTENGSWWTHNGKYYEYHKYSGLTDIYDYKVLENGDVKFKSIKLIGKDDDSYEFIDYLIKED